MHLCAQVTSPAGGSSTQQHPSDGDSLVAERQLSARCVNCAAGRVSVPAVHCKLITRQERVQKRHFRIRKKVSVAVGPPFWQQRPGSSLLAASATTWALQQYEVSDAAVLRLAAAQSDTVQLQQRALLLQKADPYVSGTANKQSSAASLTSTVLSCCRSLAHPRGLVLQCTGLTTTSTHRWGQGEGQSSG